MRTMTVDAFCDLADEGGLSSQLRIDDPIGLMVDGEVVAQVLPPSRSMPTVRNFDAADSDAVVALWQICDLTRQWNNPHRDIARKFAHDSDSFFLAESGDHLVGTVMVGYDGHRGWVNYLAVDPEWRRRGVGRTLMDHAERWLLARGCPKLNLQVRTGNDDALDFYRRLGYRVDEVTSLGKRLLQDNDDINLQEPPRA